MRVKSAGILLYRIKNDKPEFFICHTGGPYGKGPDESTWSIPKGKIEEDEKRLDAAKREVLEETGISEESYKNLRFLGIARQSRKDVFAWSALYTEEGDPIVQSNMTTMEWPRKSGKYIEVPEIDFGEFVSAEEAKFKLIKGQKGLVDRFLSRNKF